MAASGRGLSRVLGASSCPAWRGAHWEARGRLKPEYDAVVIGAGHNGLVAAAYLQRLGVNTAVFERRPVIGGAAVTEEIIPGFKFSRASYLLSLLRPQIYTDLELKKHGLRLHLRNPYSFTPMLEEGTGNKVPRSLLLGTDMAENQKQIAQFSRRDAQAFPKYEAFMNRLALAIDPLLDAAPVDAEAFQRGSLLQRLKSLSTLKPLLQAGRVLGAQLPQYYQVLTAPITKVLDQWFESEPLKATLATDAVIGAMTSPHTPGSGYVLLHHVMGGLEGMQGAWGYVQGGMGALSDAITSSATAHGASVFTEKAVAKVQVSSEGRVQGVVLQDGSEVRSKVVLSNASPQVTFLKLTPQEWLPEEFVDRISRLDTQSPVTKINVAVDRLPDFLAAPNAPGGQPLPHHQCSIHLNCEDTLLLHRAFEDAMDGLPSHSTLPTRWLEARCGMSRKETLMQTKCLTASRPTPLASRAPWWAGTSSHRLIWREFLGFLEGKHAGRKRTFLGEGEGKKPAKAGKTITLLCQRLWPCLPQNIFHCAMTLDQLYFARPVPLHSSYRCPLRGLYLCGSGAHPGGGVMGAAGRNAAHVVFRDLKSM
ncbi:pyridine nucleotide-disulfide oxidoreductase domain-containing protein 2 isoform X6 [Prionailurus viverrinus]|uniref:pyridine nucleotide-disulfide oxidoreductase domain-containing protein 2 isoform X6 n=1 Tax=Prionailurus viverrinus TaxID=61388 RepID=UPI001FF6F01F|nr:pyridine nucleotide-disulfide oxidoreductase domain-containing protein 2 isoform X6 [Prionailurus viverrinus]